MGLIYYLSPLIEVLKVRKGSYKDFKKQINSPVVLE